ncbi:MAG: hypothetical protein Q4B77_07045 [Coriobacteriaceae bacterium]|nr:hypothetical protein [Coriobacteriaceae bacterium]
MRIVMRNGMYAVSLLLVSIYFALPSFVPNDTGAFRFGAEYLRETRLDGLKEAIASGAYDTAPQNIKDANTRQLELLEITQGNDVAASLRAQEEISRIDLELYDAGNLSGDYGMLKVNHAFLEQLSGLQTPSLYETTADEPMLYRLAELFGTVPPLLLFVPVVVISFAVFRSIEDDRLGFQFPLSRKMKISLSVVTTLIVASLSFIVSLIPAALTSCLMNGFGDPSYPVVLMQSGEVVTLTVLSALARACGLLLMETLFVASLSAAFFAVTSSSVPGALTCLALGFVPSIPQYFSETFILHEVLKYLPTTYFYVAPVGGWPCYLNLMDVFPVPGASWELGMTVLFACTVVFVLLSSFWCSLHLSFEPWKGARND